MIQFFRTPSKSVIATEINHSPSSEEIERLDWLYGGAQVVDSDHVDGHYAGPRREMISPWSTNAVEITQNMGLAGISRIEEYFPVSGPEADYDPMLTSLYAGLDQKLFCTDREPEPVRFVEDIEEYNKKEGLALSDEEVEYLHKVERETGRKLTDSEVFGFAQINSEHCRHKIFGGTFVIDGEEMPSSLFQLIKRTTREHPGRILSAYKDNVAFAQGPVVEQFAPADQSRADFFVIKNIESVISLKAETHNFPTTVEPFNGASTGTGGEIRDRMGGGRGSWPLAGMAVYMTSYPRTDEGREWEEGMEPRKWLYQSPREILSKASDGASDFGNKFGQPLICGSLLTFEHEEDGQKFAYDKVIMEAGGVGYGTRRDCLKGEPKKGEQVVVMGGDNYRIGLGGGSVSSVETGRYSSGIELNAVQRANAEMQKRVYNVVRALCEEEDNPVISIHDHGAAGHVNCLSELVEECGGEIHMDRLPVGDKSLSAKEIIANESQERMGLLIDEKAIDHVRKIAERERAPLYHVGEATGDARFSFVDKDGSRPFDMAVEHMFGSSPKTVMEDRTVESHFRDVEYDVKLVDEYLRRVLQLEAVACKDWLTNKADRSVTGKVAAQQCRGEIQLPLSDCGVIALDYRGKYGIATSVGHAPQVALADSAAGSVNAVAEALTNIVWAPLYDRLSGVSLSANWMWPCRAKEGEDARLYKAVQALSDFCVDLGINVPTGKDSLSMTQKYPDGEKILSPGTVIVTAGAVVSNVKKTVSPVMVNDKRSSFYHIDFSFDELRLGGSAFAQSLGFVGDDVPTVRNSEYFADAFNVLQELIGRGMIMSGHDISAGGLITTLLEMCFANEEGGMIVNLDNLGQKDIVKALFAENAGVVVQVSDKYSDEFRAMMEDAGVGFVKIGYPTEERHIMVGHEGLEHMFGIDYLRDVWYSSSYLMDRFQSKNGCAAQRFENYKKQPLEFNFMPSFTGRLKQYGVSADRRKKSGVNAAIIREKGTNGDREMAYMLYLAGFDVKDVTMTDLVSGRETLEDVNMIVFCGGFSNSDVLGSAKGWAGAILYNPRAKEAVDRFYAREDTLSLGVCNGCQLMMELGLITPSHEEKPRMLRNRSEKFESAFLGVTVPANRSVMFESLSGLRSGIWVAHGEGRFSLPRPIEDYNVVMEYSYDEYPGNPNGSDYSVAGIASDDGRHVAVMPHLERASFPWNNAHYPLDRLKDEVTPWFEAFVNARKWVERTKK